MADAKLTIEVLLDALLNLDKQSLSEQSADIVKQIERALEEISSEGRKFKVSPTFKLDDLQKYAKTFRNEIINAEKELARIKEKEAKSEKASIKYRLDAIAQQKERIKGLNSLLKIFSRNYDFTDIPELEPFFNQIKDGISDSREQLRGMEEDVKRLNKAIERDKSLEKLAQDYGKVSKLRKLDGQESARLARSESSRRKKILADQKKLYQEAGDDKTVSRIDKELEGMEAYDKAIKALIGYPDAKLPKIVPEEGFSKAEAKQISDRLARADDALAAEDKLSARQRKRLESQRAEARKLLDESERNAKVRASQVSSDNKELKKNLSLKEQIADSERRLAEERRGVKRESVGAEDRYTKELQRQSSLVTNQIVESHRLGDLDTKSLKAKKDALVDEIGLRKQAAAETKKQSAEEEKLTQKRLQASRIYRRSLPDEPVSRIVASEDDAYLRRSAARIARATKMQELLQDTAETGDEIQAREKAILGLQRDRAKVLERANKLRSEEAEKIREVKQKEKRRIKEDEKNRELQKAHLGEIDELHRKISDTDSRALKSGTVAARNYNSSLTKLKGHYEDLIKLDKYFHQGKGYKYEKEIAAVERLQTLAESRQHARQREAAEKRAYASKIRSTFQGIRYFERQLGEIDVSKLTPGTAQADNYDSIINSAKKAYEDIKRLNFSAGHQDRALIQQRIDGLLVLKDARKAENNAEKERQAEIKKTARQRQAAIDTAVTAKKKFIAAQRELNRYDVASLQAGSGEEKRYGRSIADADSALKKLKAAYRGVSNEQSRFVLAQEESLNRIQDANLKRIEQNKKTARDEKKQADTRERYASQRASLLRKIFRAEQEIRSIDAGKLSLGSAEAKNYDELVSSAKSYYKNLRDLAVSNGRLDDKATYAALRRLRRLQVAREAAVKFGKEQEKLDIVAARLEAAQQRAGRLSGAITGKDLAALQEYRDALNEVGAARKALIRSSGEKGRYSYLIDDASGEGLQRLKIDADNAAKALRSTDDGKVQAHQDTLNALDRQIVALQKQKVLSEDIRRIQDPNQLLYVRKQIQEENNALREEQRLLQRRGGTSSRSGVVREQQELENLRLLEESNKQLQRLTAGWAGLNNTVKQFFRYALFYGGMYELISSITLLGSAVIRLEDDLKTLQAVTASTDAQMASMANSIRTVALSTKFSASEISAAATTLGQAGVEPRDMQEVLQATANFASAVGGSIETAADLITTFRQVYKDLNQTAIADQLTKAINISKLTAEDLKTSVSVAAQTSKDFGLSSRAYLGTISTLRNAGIKISTASTGLRQLLIDIFSANTSSLKQLEKRYAQLGEFQSRADIRARFASYTLKENPLLEALQELQRIGIGGAAGAEFGRIFEVRSMNVLRALLGDLDALRSNQAQLDFGGAAAEASAIRMESLQSKLTNVGAALTFFAEELTKGPVEGLKSLADSTIDAIKYLNELDLTLKSQGDSGLASSFGFGATAGAILGSVTGGSVIRKVGVGLLGAGGATTASIGAADAEAGVADAVGWMTSLLAVFLALRSPGNKVASTLSRLSASGSSVAKVLSGIGSGIAAIFGFLFKLTPIRLAIAAALASAASLRNQIPTIGRLFGRIPELIGDIIDYIGGIVEDVIKFAEPVTSFLGKAADKAEEYLAKKFPKTEEEIAEEAAKLKEASRAAIQLVANELSEATEEFEKFKEYDPTATSGTGAAIRELGESATLQRRGIAELLSSVGASGQAEALQEVLNEYRDNASAREKGQASNQAFLEKVSKAIGVSTAKLGKQSTALTQILNAESSLQQDFEALAKNLKTTRDKLSGLTSDEIADQGLEPLAEAFADFSSEISEIIAVPDPGDRDKVLQAASDLTKAIYDSGLEVFEKSTDNVVGGIEEADETLGQKARDTVLKEIADLNKKGNYPEVQKRLNELYESQGKYFDSIQAFADNLGAAFDRLNGEVPGGIDLPSSLNISGRYSGPDDISDIVGNATTRNPRLIKDIEYAINSAASVQGINPRLLAALIKQESNFNPAAYNKGSQASGLTQFIPGTAAIKRYGISKEGYANYSSATGQRELIDGAAAYLRYLLDMFNGDVSKALAGYNWGENRDTIRRGDFVNYPAETRDYIRKITATVGATSAEDQVALAAIRFGDDQGKERDVVKKSAGQLREDLNNAEQDVLASVSTINNLGRIVELRLASDEELGGFIEKGRNGPELERGLQETYDKYTRTIEARDNQLAREKQENYQLFKQRAAVAQQELTYELEDAKRRGVSAKEFAQLRNKQTQIAEQILQGQIREIQEGRGGGSKDSEAVRVAGLNADIAKEKLKELRDVENYQRERKTKDIVLDKNQAQLEASEARTAAESAILRGSDEEAALYTQQYLEALRRKNAAEQQRIAAIEDAGERQKQQAIFDARASEASKTIVDLLEKRADQAAEDLKYGLQYGARDAEEAQKFAAEAAEGIPVDREEEVRRLNVQLAAYDQLLQNEQLVLTGINEQLEAGNLSRKTTNDLLQQEENKQLEIEAIELRRASVQGQIAEKKVGVAQVGATFTKQATDQIEGLEEAIGGGLVGGVNDLASSFLNAAVAGESMGDAIKNVFHKMFLQIATTITQALLLKAILGAFSGLGGAFGGEAGGVVSPVTKQFGGIIRKGEGGLISGNPGVDTTPGAIIHPNGSTSPLLVTHGEAIIPEGMVSNLGKANVQAAINRYNSTGVARFAEGGVVSGTQSRTSQQTDRQTQPAANNVGIKIVNVPGNSVVADYLQSTEGEKVVLNVLERNPQQARKILGG